jgi:hypothetical protein
VCTLTNASKGRTPTRVCSSYSSANPFSYGTALKASSGSMPSNGGHSAVNAALPSFSNSATSSCNALVTLSAKAIAVEKVVVAASNCQHMVSSMRIALSAVAMIAVAAIAWHQFKVLQDAWTNYCEQCLVSSNALSQH